MVSPALNCDAPALVGLTRALQPDYAPNDANDEWEPAAGVDTWIIRRVEKSNAPGYFDFHFNRNLAGTWDAPANSPETVNDPAANVRVYNIAVATDDAGDAVFAWVQTSDGEGTYQAKVRAYNGTSGLWTAEHEVSSNVFDRDVTLRLAMHHSSGMALVAFIPGPFQSNPTPHFRSYDVLMDQLGPDVDVGAPSNNYNYFADLMGMDLHTNANLTGFAVWFEKDATTSVVTLNALHIVNGVGEAGTGRPFNVVALATGMGTSNGEEVNEYSPMGYGRDRLPRGVAVSPNGNAAVVWKVNNALPAPNATLYARRYVNGAWSPKEPVDTADYSNWDFYDWDVDDQGNVAVITSGRSPSAFSYAAAGGAFSTMTAVGPNTATSRMARVALQPGSGTALVAYTDATNNMPRLMGVNFVPGASFVSSPFIMDAAQGIASGGRILPLQAGPLNARVVFHQTVPGLMGHTSNNNSLQYVSGCQ